VGGNKSSIFAYAAELDGWMRERGQAFKDGPPEIENSVLFHTPLAGEESVDGHKILDVSLISGPAKARSAELVVLANRMWEALSRSNLRLIARLFREAIDLDPGNAAAFAGLSFALIAEGLWGLVHIPDAYASAQAASQRALEIDSELQEAKCSAAWLKMVSTRDWEGARSYFDEALNCQSLYPNCISGRAALYIAEGRLSEASGLLLKAARRNALSSALMEWYCWSEYLAGEYANALLQIEQYRTSGRQGPIVDTVEALAYIQLEEPDAHIERIEEMAADSPRNEVLRGALGYVYGVSGQGQRARELLDAITYLGKRSKTREPYAVALVLIGLNEKQEAVQWLEQSYREGSLWSLGFRSDPMLASLRGDPHYQLFMSKASYPVPESSGSRLD
jgi:tetratricopeptide (TPR) repeat protein